MTNLILKPSHLLENVLFPKSLNSIFDELNQMNNNQMWFKPHSDIVEKNETYEIKVALPGYQKEDIEITTEGDYIVVSGERKTETSTENEKVLRKEIQQGKFRRVYNFNNIEKNSIEAKFESGILNLTLPKLKQEIATKIEIK